MNIKITLAQINPELGEIDGNLNQILHAIEAAKTKASDLIIFPECALTGYPLKDLVFQAGLHKHIECALQTLIQASDTLAIVVGYPKIIDHQMYNCAGWFFKGCILQEYRKQALANTTCFDEIRIFKSGSPQTDSIEHCGHRFSLSICHDIWEAQKTIGTTHADYLINISASPFHRGKRLQRTQIIQTFAQTYQKHVIYVNSVGAQDGLIFDGGSQIITPDGTCLYEAPYFETQIKTLSFNTLKPLTQCIETRADLYQALVLGLRDYIIKNNLSKVCLGLSGGIDSALVCCLAVDALGPENVTALFMPSDYTSNISEQGATQLSNTLQIQLIKTPITALFKQLKTHLTASESDQENISIPLQNLQARLRALILMYHSNVQNALLLSCGNKSELAMGYCTLYGDLAGAIAPIADLTKTQVYELAQWLNQTTERIPTMILERAPSAELAPHQLDTDDLPSYQVLDPVLELILRQQTELNEIETSTQTPLEQAISKKLKENEFKRQQSGVILRISESSFNLDRRYPITYNHIEK